MGRPPVLGRAIVLVVVAIATLSGCISAPPAPADDRQPGERLVGIWRVFGVAGDRSWVRFDGGTFALWVDCGIRSGEWESSGATMVTGFTGFYSECDFNPDTAEGNWLLSAVTIREAAGSIILLNSDGIPVATLKKGGVPPAVGAQDALLEEPELDSDELSLFQSPAELQPEEKLLESLVGSWVPASENSGDSGIYFDPDGSVGGKDGCRVFSDGRWVYAPNGQVLIAGLQINSISDSNVEQSGSIVCRNNPYPFHRIASAKIINGSVIFSDAQNNTIARVVQPSGPAL